MNMLDKFLNVLGFEGQEDVQKNKKTKSKRGNPVASSFNLKKSTHSKRLPATRVLSSQDQVIDVLEELTKKGSIIIDISGFDKDSKIRAFDFISGAVYAYGGQMEKIQTGKYICSLEEIGHIEEEIWLV